MNEPATAAPTRSRHRLKVILGLSLVLWLLASLAITHARNDTTQALPGQVDRVVFFGVPGLSFHDVNPSTMPNLASLARRGAVAGANVRSGGNEPNVAEAYTTLGAGYRIQSGSKGMISNDGAGGGVRVLDMPPPLTTRGTSEEGRPGALADALHDAGMRTAVVNNADVVVGTRRRAAPAALAAADAAGEIDAGTVGPELTTNDPRAPGDVRSASRAFADRFALAQTSAEVIVADPGDTSRLVRMAKLTGRRPTSAERRRALTDTDARIGAVASSIGPRTVLIVVGVTPPTSTWALTPVVAAGAGIATGHLSSPSTHRRDLITLPDLAPTALSLLGVTVPASMSGHVLRVRPGDTSLTSIGEFSDMLVSRRSTDQPLTLTFILFQSLLYVLAVGELVRRNLRTRAGRVLIFGALTCAAWPLATFLLRSILPLSTLGVWTFAISWACAALIAFGASRFRAHPLDPLLIICGLTVATIVIDVSTGSRLQYGSFFGYAPNKGTRFTGLGNAGFALLAGSTVVVCTALVARARNRIDGWWSALTVALVVIAADGAPWMGADVGGILTTVPILGLLLWALRGRALKWRSFLIVLGATAAVLGIAVGLDALRAPEQRTHVSRFFLQLGDFGLVRATISAKWSDNMRLLRESMWAWLVPITAAFSFIALTAGRLWERALPPGSPQRLGVMATLAVGLLGWLLNDSGIVVVALASVYIGPFVLLLAQADDPSKSFVDPPATPAAEQGIA